MSYPNLAIVTGSDSGIGAACATLLAADGYDVGLTFHHDEQALLETVRAVEERGQRAFVEPYDAASPRAGDVVDVLAERLGGLGVVINVAGTGHTDRVLDVSYERWRQVLATDLDGPFLVAQRAAQRLVDAGNGGGVVRRRWRADADGRARARPADGGLALGLSPEQF